MAYSRFLVGLPSFDETLLVVRLDDAGYAGHTAVTYLDCAPVEYFAEFGSFGEVLVDEFQERFADVGCNIFTARRVEPDDVSLSVAHLLGSVFCV